RRGFSRAAVSYPLLAGSLLRLHRRGRIGSPSLEPARNPVDSRVDRIRRTPDHPGRRSRRARDGTLVPSVGSEVNSDLGHVAVRGDVSFVREADIVVVVALTGFVRAG